MERGQVVRGDLGVAEGRRIVAEILRAEVSGVRPHHRAECHIHIGFGEQARIAQGSNDLPVEDAFNIDLSGGTVIEAHLQAMWLDDSGLSNDVHAPYQESMKRCFLVAYQSVRPRAKSAGR
jgi:hypothetical protein